MKIAIDSRNIGKNRTGDESYFFNLIKEISRIDQENQYFLVFDRSPSEDKKLEEKIKQMKLGSNFKIEIACSKNRFLWNLIDLPRKLNLIEPDIYHTQYISPISFPRKTKLITTIHDISFNYFPHYIRKSDLLFLKLLISRAIRLSSAIITVSKNEKNNIASYYRVNKDKIYAIYNGVDILRFSDVEEDVKEKVRRKYNLPKKFFLYVGTLQPRKNIPALLRAYREYLKNNAQKIVSLVIGGNRKATNYDQKIDATLRRFPESGNIIFTGWIDDQDLPALYKLATAFVFPSLYEGFGIPIIEAMAAGTPVLSSNRSCLTEIGADAVYYTDPNNLQEFSQKLSEIVNNKQLRVNLIRRGLKRAQQFSWKNSALKTLEIYKKIYYNKLA